MQAETVTYLDSQHILPAKYTAARLMSTYRGQFVQARLPLAWDELESSGDLNEKRTNTHTPTQRRKSGAITAEFVPECELMSADPERASDGPLGAAGQRPAHASSA